MFRRFAASIGLAIGVLAMGLAGCTGGKAPAGQDITIDSVDLLTLESYPPQFTAAVTGSLADGCVQIDGSEQAVNGSTIQITIRTTRMTDALCTDALVPFIQNIPVDIAGLAPGEYAIEVNSVDAGASLLIEDWPIPTDLGEGDGSGRLARPEQCPVGSAEVYELVDQAQGLCFVYAAAYQIDSPQPGTFVISGEAEGNVRPSLLITIEAAEGHTLDDVQAALAADYAGIDVTFQATTLGGQPALVSETLPGVTATRQAFVVWADRLYTLVLQPVDSALPDHSEAAEQIWAEVAGSLTFIPVIEGEGF